METPTITEFLLARIAEDEDVAREAEKASPLPPQTRLGVCGDTAWGAMGYVDTHPARVLAECRAKRAIVESVTALTGDGEKTYLERLAHTDAEDRQYQIVRDVLRLLAAVYADHPDYREEWKP